MRGSEVRRGLGDLPEVDVGEHPDVIAAFRADPLRFLLEVYERCGAVARAAVGSAEVVVLSGLEANQFVFADADQWDYESSASVFADEFGPTYLTSLNGPAHLDKRRQMAAGFRASVMSENAPLLADEAQNVLRDEEGSSSELRTLAQTLVIHMSGRAVLGRPLPDQLVTDIAFVENHLLSGRVDGARAAGHFEDPAYLEHKASLLAQLDEIIRDRSWQSGTAETVLESLVTRDDGNPVPTEEVVADLFLLLAAGSETTSAAITWGLLFLAANPEWSARLRHDLADWQPAAGIDIREHSALAAVVLETERMRPPLPLQLKVAAKDLTFLDTVIPAGTRVFHAACVTHQLPEIFPDPQSWTPERFLEGSRHLPPRCLGTFGGTSHVCLGLPLARLEQMVAVAVVTSGWDISLQGPPSFGAKMAPVLVPADPVPAVQPEMTARRVNV